MLVSLEWLNDFVKIDCTPEALAEKLVRSGFEIEEIIRDRKSAENVVAGRIIGLKKHPDANKLQVCEIDAGGAESLQIVTGASNVNVGDLVPVALDGSDLPNGTHIKRGKLRGVMSFGMLCSGGELMLTESDYPGAGVDGIMILKGDTKPGTDINEIIPAGNIILDVGVTANRPDCNSILGIAREVAAVLNKPLKMPEIDYKSEGGDNIDDYLKINVINDTVCPRYMAGMVKDIVIKESPDYIKRRLASVGIRSINNIVDITNYVLTEIGQPMHAFDYSCIESGIINVRSAANGESIVALDNKEYALNDSMLVIADGEKPGAIAGIMGGEKSGIKDTTDTVVFESANFRRDSIRRTSRKLGLKSDSCARYERGIDLMSQELGLKRALTLIYKTKSGRIVTGIADKCSMSLEPRKVTCKVSAINEILGITVPEADILTILNSLGIQSSINNGLLECVPPLYREDIENANDLAEEVIRMYGYDRIESRLLKSSTVLPANSDYRHMKKVKEILTSNGLNEILTYSFTSPKSFDALLLKPDSQLRNAAVLLNSLGEDTSVMRTNLTYSMLETMVKNINRGNSELRLFEAAKVYFPNELPMTALPREETHIVIGLSGKNEDYYTLKGVIEGLVDYVGGRAKFKRSDAEYLHAGISADLMLNKVKVGSFGEINPSITANLDVKEKLYIAELNYDAMIAMYNDNYEFKPIPKYPSVERDIAVLIDEEISGYDILNAVKEAGGKLLISADIFDIYKGKNIPNGMKSVAIKIILNDMEKTLLDSTIENVVNNIVSRLGKSFDAKLR